MPRWPERKRSASRRTSRSSTPAAISRRTYVWTPPSSAAWHISINKAYTAIAFQCQTKDLTDITRPDADLYGLNDAHGGRIVVFPGGIPLVRDGHVVGAIGVSTGTIEQDQAVAEAGAAAF